MNHLLISPAARAIIMVVLACPLPFLALAGQQSFIYYAVHCVGVWERVIWTLVMENGPLRHVQDQGAVGGAGP